MKALKSYLQWWCLTVLVKPWICKTCMHLYYSVLHNTAVGIPPPNITWSYNTTFGGIQELTPLNSNTTSIEMGMDDSGRHKVKSILSLRISPADGGVITCIAGARQESALLTVLGKTMR